MESKTLESNSAPSAPPVLQLGICEAIESAQTWRGMNSNRAKAFLIPIADLLACFVEMEIATYNSEKKEFTVKEDVPHDLRAYMGTKNDPSYWNDPNKGYGNKLLIVATKWDDRLKKYVDIVDRITNCPENNHKSSINGDGLVGSGVYDFTVPCPNECDPSSSLMK
ncbi:hypothetical protein [Winogradskyella sp. 3972H.M.0a.05]|uniref:hypothetical protein n=1 Tax=Winogradskyella sp. 3972H.M.0a.05 TaxID=2950277 RepID=UPI003390A541